MQALVDLIRVIFILVIVFMMAVRAFNVLHNDKYYMKPASLFIYSLWLLGLIVLLIGGITLC